MTCILLLSASLGLFAETPEALLDSLCAHSRGTEGVSYWEETADPEGTSPPADPDTLARMLGSRSGLSVEPGEDELGERGETHYVKVYAESRWRWSDSTGTGRVAAGRTEVVYRDGRYYWREVPLQSGRGGTVTGRQRLLMGMIATGALAVVGGMALWWARRRWGA